MLRVYVRVERRVSVDRMREGCVGQLGRLMDRQAAPMRLQAVRVDICTEGSEHVAARDVSIGDHHGYQLSPDVGAPDPREHDRCDPEEMTRAGKVVMLVRASKRVSTRSQRGVEITMSHGEVQFESDDQVGYEMDR
jgi:hypothetical protein